MANICDECGTMIADPRLDGAVEASEEENRYFHGACYDTFIEREDGIKTVQ